MKILHILPSVDPQGGGPMEGVRQRGLRLLEMNHQVEVVSLDDPESPFLAGYGLPVHALGPSKGGYRFNSQLVPWLHDHAREYDAVVVNGLWQYHSFGAWCALHRRKVPYFVFTHGMLDPWFKRTYPLKHLKKWLYWPWAEYRVLRDARRVIFTCEEERLSARKSFWLYKVNETVTAYGVANPPANADELASAFLAQYPHLQGKRIALYLSRIHVKKGCDLLIEAFSRIVQRDESLHLVMAGPDQIGWVPKLKAQAEALGIAHRITWPGMLQSEMKWGAFYAAEVFCLPSHQENFGIVVAEALACGKPVLISNKVNIWREIEADGAGFVEDDTLAGTVANFERWLALSPGDFQAVKARAAACFARRFHVLRAAEQLLEIVRESNDSA